MCVCDVITCFCVCVCVCVFAGVCLGMQVSVIEFARNVLNWEGILIVFRCSYATIIRSVVQKLRLTLVPMHTHTLLSHIHSCVCLIISGANSSEFDPETKFPVVSLRVCVCVCVYMCACVCTCVSVCVHVCMVLSSCVGEFM